MNVDLRKAVLDNLKNSSTDEIFQTINDAVKNNDDITLPGLGVLFEVVWKKSDRQVKDSIVHKLTKI